MLAPRELAIEQARFDWRQFCGVIILRNSQVSRSEQPKYPLGGHCGHIAALLVEPFRIALLRHAVADEGQAWRAQGAGDLPVDAHELIALVKRGAHKAMSSCASTGRSPAFLLPKVASAAPYFRKLPAIQWYSPEPVRFSTASPKFRRCSFAPPSPEEPTSTRAKRLSRAIVSSAAFP